MADHLDALAVIQKGATVEDVSNHLGVDLFEAHRLVEDLRRERKIKWNRLGWWESAQLPDRERVREVAGARGARAYRLYQDGMTWKQVGEVMGRSHGSVHRSAKRHAELKGWAWPPRPAGRMDAKAYDLRIQGMTWEEVARAVGRSTACAQDGAKRHAERLGKQLPSGKATAAKRAERAYRFRSQGRRWRDIAVALDMESGDTARRGAKRHAERRGLPWPVRRA